MDPWIIEEISKPKQPERPQLPLPPPPEPRPRPVEPSDRGVVVIQL
jgi:hypothetical protein